MLSPLKLKSTPLLFAKSQSLQELRDQNELNCCSYHVWERARLEIVPFSCYRHMVQVQAALIDQYTEKES